MKRDQDVLFIGQKRAANAMKRAEIAVKKAEAASAKLQKQTEVRAEKQRLIEFKAAAKLIKIRKIKVEKK